MLGITRSIAGGGTYLIIFQFQLFHQSFDGKTHFKVLTIPAIFLLVIALAVTFGRGVWMVRVQYHFVSAICLRGGEVQVCIDGCCFLSCLGCFLVLSLLNQNCTAI